MKTPPIIQQLMEEHERIDRMAESLFRWASEGQDAAPEARTAYVDFFRIWVCGFHEDQEETILFPVLAEQAEIPLDRGPVMVLHDEHEQEKTLVDRLERAAAGPETVDAARALAHLVWAHIDKENSVMLPEAGERLVRTGAGAVSGREETDAEHQARRAAEPLIEAWPPLEDDDFFRGDGCMMCPAYGDRCGGIEKEWWNEYEWDHHASYRE